MDAEETLPAPRPGPGTLWGSVRAMASFLGYMLGFSSAEGRPRAEQVLPASTAGVLYVRLDETVADLWTRASLEQIAGTEQDSPLARWLSRHLVHWQVPGWLGMSIDRGGTRTFFEGARMGGVDRIVASMSPGDGQTVEVEDGVAIVSEGPLPASRGVSVDAVPMPGESFRGEYAWADWIPEVVPPRDDPNELDPGLILRASVEGRIEGDIAEGMAELALVDEELAHRVRLTLERWCRPTLELDIRREGHVLHVAFRWTLTPDEIRRFAAPPGTAKP